MKTEYVSTDFPVITDACRDSYRIRGRARGVLLIPLAKGESPPGDAIQSIPAPANYVNSASVDKLVEVCGIGQELAEAIVARRGSFGPFHTAKDLEAVSGIGPVTASKIWQWF